LSIGMIATLLACSCCFARCAACSRTFINDTPVAFDPERAMAELVLHTHYLPRHWRGRAHSAEVQQSVNSMFTLKVCALVCGFCFAVDLDSVPWLLCNC
jgi:hypothetical protein